MCIGATDYSDQSLSEMREDIVFWKNFSNEVHSKFDQALSSFSKNTNKSWEKAPMNFKIWCNKIVKITKTFIEDLGYVLDCIDNNTINQRCISLLKNIGESTERYLQAFKESFDSEYQWKDYGEADYRIVEDLYCEGGDYFGTLWDSSNLASRLEDFMENKTEVNVDNSIHIGDNNDLRKAKIGSSSKTKNESFANTDSKKESFFKKWWWCFVVPLAVAIIAGIVVAIVTGKR